ncbi:MAG TPA: hypothetical protein VGR43_06085 [Dehalococcoidia bacterium]|nr:hypothetical protein [Dehalococcoidia bacterium]
MRDPPNNPWNTDISNFTVHAQSDAFVDSIGRTDYLHPDFGTVWQGAPIGIPYVIVPGSQPMVPVTFDYADESDPGPYPVPPNAPIEGGPNSSGDRHVLVIDNDNCILYEMFDATPVSGGQSWTAGSGAVFDLSSNALRPDFWTSADAAGLPIFPGLVRYEEVVEQGVIDHALRFTINTTRRAFIHPATHFASSNTNESVPPMGLRFRMKASYSCAGFSAEVQVICTALKKYGMFVSDNGSDWYVSGAPDPRWSDDNLGDLKSIPGDAFEVVNTGQPVITDQPEGDNDGDGYTNGTEEHVGTGPQDPCGGTGWPSDLVPGGIAPNTLNVEDAGSFVAPVRRLGKSPGDQGYGIRWDLVPGAASGALVNVQDLGALFLGATGYPPMLGGQRTFGQQCPFAP